MINYYCDVCNKSCDYKYIQLQITEDLRSEHLERRDTNIDSKIDTIKETKIKMLCPDCFKLAKDFLREVVKEKARRQFFG